MVGRALRAAIVTMALLGCGILTMAQAQSANTGGSAQALPQGWTQDEAFRAIGKDVYHSPDKGVVIFIDDEAPSNLSPRQWIMQYTDQQLNDKHIRQKSDLQPIPSVPDAGLWIFTIAEDANKGLYIQVFAAVVREGERVKVAKIVWNNKSDANAAHTLTAMQILANTRAKAASNHAIQSSTQKTNNAKSVLDLDEDETSANPIVANSGEGVAPSEIHGVVYHWGKSKMRVDYKRTQTVTEWPDAATYLLLKNGWAYRNPDVPPADLNQDESRRLQPERWSQWRSNPALQKEQAMAPLNRGYTLDIQVQRPSTSFSYTTTRSTWKSLKLTRSGRFETGRTSISSSNYDGDRISGNEHRVVSSSNKDGEFSSVRGAVTVGGGTVTLTSATSKKGGKGAHSGHYLIHGNTIELRYDNGTIVRALFGTDGSKNVVFGNTNYWTQKK